MSPTDDETIRQFAEKAREEGWHPLDVREMIRVGGHYATLSMWSLDMALHFVYQASGELSMKIEPRKEEGMNDLQLGQVVAHTTTHERGVVVHVDGKGFSHQGPHSTRYVVQEDEITAFCTDNTDDDWLPVARGDWTYSEKVLSAAVRWNPPPGSEQDSQSLSLAILNGLLFNSGITVDESVEGDPYRVGQLVAQHLDERIQVERLRGMSQERFKDR